MKRVLVIDDLNVVLDNNEVVNFPATAQPSHHKQQEHFVFPFLTITDYHVRAFFPDTKCTTIGIVMLAGGRS